VKPASPSNLQYQFTPYVAGDTLGNIIRFLILSFASGYFFKICYKFNEKVLDKDEFTQWLLKILEMSYDWYMSWTYFFQFYPNVTYTYWQGQFVHLVAEVLEQTLVQKVLDHSFGILDRNNPEIRQRVIWQKTWFQLKFQAIIPGGCIQKFFQHLVEQPTTQTVTDFLFSILEVRLVAVFILIFLSFFFISTLCWRLQDVPFLFLCGVYHIMMMQIHIGALLEASG